MTLPEVGVGNELDVARRQRSTLDQHRDEQQGVELLGVRVTGENEFKVRFLAVRATEWVEVHLQHDGAAGGGVDYNDVTYVSRTLVDCRENRLQEVTVTTTTDDKYHFWLTPVLMEE